MAFKMSGYSGYHGDKPAPKKNVGKTGYGPKSAAYQKTDTDDKIKESLLAELNKMKDPVNSNRGQNIVKQLMGKYGMDEESIESQVENW